MGNCPLCGAPLEVGTILCPSCGNEVTQQTAEQKEVGDQLVDSGQDDTLAGDGSGDTIDTGDGSDTIGPVEGGTEDAEPPLEVDSSVPGSGIPQRDGMGLDHSVPGSEIPPSRGRGWDHSQPPNEEPPEGWTDTKDIDMPYGDVPDRDISMDGPAVDMTGGVVPGMPSPGAGEPAGAPHEQRTTRLQYGAFLVVILVIIIAATTLYLLSGDDDGNGNGDGNGEPNGHNGPGPKESLHIDPLETSVDPIWEPVPGFHLDVIILNNATETKSLDGHDLYVTIFIGMDKVGQATETVSGDLASGGSKWVPIDAAVGLTSGQTYKVSVMLRTDDGNTMVDLYYKEVTVE